MARRKTNGAPSETVLPSASAILFPIAMRDAAHEFANKLLALETAREDELESLRRQVADMRDSCVTLERERNKLRDDLAERVGYVPGREIVIGGDDTGTDERARLVLENKSLRDSNEELAGKLENMESDEEELERLTKREKDLEKELETACEGETSAIHERDAAVESAAALRIDLVNLSRWIFSLGGTFADVASLVSGDGMALVQLAYTGGSHELLDDESESAPFDAKVAGTHAGVCLFSQPKES